MATKTAVRRPRLKPEIVDHYGELRQRLAELRHEEEILRAQLNASLRDGGVAIGDVYVITKSITSRQNTLDEVKIARKLGVLVEDLDPYRKPRIKASVLGISLKEDE